MGIAERRRRERAERERRIVEAARLIATAEGWGAVTIRRLAEAIEYSQPVLYAHFAGRDEIVAAVATGGFRELALALRRAADGATGGRDALGRVAGAYLGFAAEQPALYEAMFILPTDLRFAKGDAPPELKEAFASLAAVVARPGLDADTATETFWAALHGLAELERSGRVRPEASAARVALAVNGVLHY